MDVTCPLCNTDYSNKEKVVIRQCQRCIEHYCDKCMSSCDNDWSCNRQYVCSNCLNECKKCSYTYCIDDTECLQAHRDYHKQNKE